nr:hypothetical protein [Candidatus Mycoplasma haematolamae]
MFSLSSIGVASSFDTDLASNPEIRDPWMTMTYLKNYYEFLIKERSSKNS